jgi:carboxypeptidase C (cathepsin A)
LILSRVVFASLLAVCVPGLAAAASPPKPAPSAPPTQDAAARQPDADQGPFKPDAVATDGSVTIGGHRIDYQAVAGTLVVHPKGFDDVARVDKADGGTEHKMAEASMFYVAYFAKGVGPRPITFLYNGGPGSATVWLHMGAFGPRRVVTADDSHTPPAPYQLVNNHSSLLDVSDLVFIDAPGTGFSRIAGKDREKSFYGIDADAHAFAEFITQFLGKYGRWNSPKYLFGESYGTTRSAVLANLLENDYATDLNGVILLSQILAFDLSPDRVENNPGIDLAYQLALPTYAATAWYHHKLPGTPPADLPAFLHQVEQFATGEYALALEQGAALPDAQRQAIVAKLHAYTGLSEAYISRADLRIDGHEFSKTLLDDQDQTTGRLDTRFAGPTLDPLSKNAEYDPQSAALSSAYVSSFNDYVRRVLKYGQDQTYKPSIRIYRSWDQQHSPPGQDRPLSQTANVLPDLADAMKTNPLLHVQLNQGYFDLATPYFEGVYEMRHLPMQRRLQANIEVKQYQSGHMVYAHASALTALHDNVAAFIRRTDNLAH